MTAPRLFVVGLLTVGGGVFMAWFDYGEFVYLYAGLMIGVVLRDLGWFRNVTRGWPYLSEVLDWSKIERLMEDDAEYEGVAGPR